MSDRKCYTPVTKYPCVSCEDLKDRIRLLKAKQEEINNILKEIDDKPVKYVG